MKGGSGGRPQFVNSGGQIELYQLDETTADATKEDVRKCEFQLGDQLTPGIGRVLCKERVKNRKWIEKIDIVYKRADVTMEQVDDIGGKWKKGTRWVIIFPYTDGSLILTNEWKKSLGGEPLEGELNRLLRNIKLENVPDYNIYRFIEDAKSNLDTVADEVIISQLGNLIEHKHVVNHTLRNDIPIEIFTLHNMDEGLLYELYDTGAAGSPGAAKAEPAAPGAARLTEKESIEATTVKAVLSDRPPPYSPTYSPTYIAPPPPTQPEVKVLPPSPPIESKESVPLTDAQKVTEMFKKKEQSAIQEVEQQFSIPVISIIDINDILAYLDDKGDMAKLITAIKTYRST